MKIGICGYGVIGSGVKTLVDNSKDFEVSKVFDRPIKQSELKELYVSDYNEIINDKNIDIVVEAMGGDKLPYEIIKKALQSKKSVVTSNKEVVSLHLDEFNELAKENDVYFMFEASVGGGIPIINSLIQNQKVNDINHIYGILNGTTNFILTKIEEGKSFEDALKEAQIKGFAEADPTADLEGLDMVRKISILSDIAYHTFIDVNQVNHRGIKGITKEIMDAFNALGYTIKFICESIKNGENVTLTVQPVCVKQNSVLANIHNEFNCVFIDGSTNGLLSFIGKGAGSFPTASAMLSDMYLIKDDNANKYLNLNEKVKYKNEDENEYLVFIKNENKVIKVKEINEYRDCFFAKIF